jgi:4-amino-4-deoxychorismate lyase
MYWYAGSLIDREEITLGIDDLGWLYGANIFTTLRVYGGNLYHPLTLWDLHRQRIDHSLLTLDWRYPDWNSIVQGIGHLIDHYPVLRITIFADGRELIIGRQLPVNLLKQQQQGIIAITLPDYGRSLPHLKTGNYLAAYLARQRAIKLGGSEGILVNSDGEWLETTTGNLWGYSVGKWWTPPLEGGILPGVMRSHLISELGKDDIIVHQDPWNKSLVSQLEMVFHTNAVIGCVPITMVYDGGDRYTFTPDLKILNHFLPH